MPRPYTPPLAGPAQAVESATTVFLSRRARWLVPLLALMPVVVTVVLASAGRFGPPNGQPRATSTVATAAPGVLPASGPTRGAARPTSNLVAAATQATIQAAPPEGATRSQGAGTTTTQSTGGIDNQSTPVAAIPDQGAGGIDNQSTPVAATPNQSTTGTNQARALAAANQPTRAVAPFRTYAVQPGDTLKYVAHLYGVSPASISQASGLQNPDRLRVGQVLTVPTQPGWLYRVQQGETLDQIAARAGVTTEIIARASKLTTGSVQAGDVILIPDAAGLAGK